MSRGTTSVTSQALRLFLGMLPHLQANAQSSKTEGARARVKKLNFPTLRTAVQSKATNSAHCSCSASKGKPVKDLSVAQTPAQCCCPCTLQERLREIPPLCTAESLLAIMATINMLVQHRLGGKRSPACLTLKETLFIPHTLEKWFMNSFSRRK
ncbi:transmembrane protease serine 11E-like [Platysternon megacephalum]|uniref:Transmembrane protease serine 11E-like n=1 Tax=Platysternon megacephalum TaxID=55544 RepID=A0A4D9E6B3_9SAUR|nr:transmembrane protease serine 11E-like [Platysternon megacephalum]